MFQNPVRQAIRRTQIVPLRETCLRCQCACGRVLQPQVSSIQKRFARRSPALKRKEDAREDARLAGVKPLATRLAELDEADVVQMLQAYTNAPTTQCMTYASFATRFALELAKPGLRDNFYDRTQGPPGSGSVVNAQILRNLQNEYEFSDLHIAHVAILVRNLPRDDFYFIGNALHYAAANAGNEWAMICVADNAFHSMKHLPEVWSFKQNARVRKLLEQVALKGNNYRAAVLAGQIAFSEGKSQDGVKFMRLGMDGAVAASEAARWKRMTKAPANPDGADLDGKLAGTSLADLSAPWVELGTYYIGQKDWANARWAIAIGCQQDDPNSHFQASLFEKEENSVRSGWFHHISKAATSGYVRAMHDLALWYAQDGWPYLSDEPPDEIKPTPFDKWPKQRYHTDGPSPWQRLLVSLGLSSPVADKAVAQTFHSAAYPTTHVERFGMALEWMKVAMGFYYAPSYLTAAELLLKKNIYWQAATPKEALELSKARYTYASEKRYKANKPLKRPPREEIEVKNPFYNPEEAKRLIREIFYAASALEIKRHNTRKKLARKIGTTSEETMYEDQLAEDLGVNLRKWFRYPEVRELFMDERTGKMIDRERDNADLLGEAKDMCEKQNWNIYGEDGSLLYRCGIRKEPPP